MIKTIIVIVSLITSQCWAAQYYVAKDGLDIIPYNTWNKAANSPKTVIDYIRNAGRAGNVVLIGVGNWSDEDEICFDHPNHSNTTVIGAGRAETIINPTGHAVYGHVADDVTIGDLTLIADSTDYAIHKRGDCEGWMFINVDMVSDINHQERLISLEGGTTAFTWCRFNHRAPLTNGCVAHMSNDSVSMFDYCVFAPAVHSYCIGYIMCAGIQADFVNCEILGFSTFGLISAHGTTNVTNSIIAANGVRNSAYTALRGDSGGILNVCNSLLMGNIWDGDAEPAGGFVDVDLNNIRESIDPRFRRHSRRGYILPCVDDSMAFGYAQKVSTLLAEHNMEGTYFLTQCSWSGENTTALRTMVADGTMEVGCHAYSHSPLLCRNALLVNYNGSETGPTAEVTADGIIQLRTAGGADNYDLNTNILNWDTIGEVVALNGIEHWVITKALTDGVGLRDACLTSSLQQQPVAAVPYTIGLNISGYDAGFFRDEIANPRIWMTNTLVNGNGGVIDGQTGEPYVCRTFAPPFGPQTVGSRQACINAGYLLSRGRRPAGVSAHEPKYGVALVDADLYAMRFFWGYGSLNSTEAQVRSSARALAYGAIEAGLAVPVLAHSEEEMTLQEWEWCLEEWDKFGDDLMVTSHQLFADAVRDPEGPWTARGDGTYFRTYDYSTDYHLAPGSPCIDAGLDMGRDYAVDYGGVDQDLWGPWEIGAFVYEDLPH
ncbi:polysaccharide deacetylase family protein [Planctomycetota bacterium]